MALLRLLLITALAALCAAGHPLHRNEGNLGRIGAVSTGFEDPAGFTWDYAWNFADGTPTGGDIPPLNGTEDLPLTIGTYTRGTYDADYDPTGLNLEAGDGPLVVAGNDFDLDPLDAADGAGPSVHIRLVLSSFQVAGAGNSSLFVGDSTAGEAYLRIRLVPSVGQIRGGVTNASGASELVVTQTGITAGDPYVVDVVVWTTGSDRNIALYVNGLRTADTTAGDTWAGLGQGRIFLDNVFGDISFFGVRFGTGEFFVQADHDLANDAAIDPSAHL